MAGRKKGSTTVGEAGRRVGRQLTMTDEEWDTLKKEAEARGLSKAALVRMAVKEYCQRHPAPELDEEK